MITKAGVPNNKIFVGESSYGRTFHMASNGCWGPTCDFTGSRTQSDAKPGRCTKTGGYIAYAEILEILKKGDDVKVFHDGDSNTDVMLYEGDYVSYMTPTTKDTRREDWKKLNFAGSIDWAVDLQSFTAEDWDIPPERSDSGVGCVEGRDMTTNTGDLCEFACGYGFCPRTLCDCVQSGKLPPLPKEVPDVNIVAIDVLDVDLNRLCKFSCKYGFCPPDLCVPPEPEDDGVVQIGEQDSYFNYTDARWEAAHHCLFYKGAKFSDSAVQCEPVCHEEIEKAKEEGRITNYGCVGNYPLDKPLPWRDYPGTHDEVLPGMCNCDNGLINYLAETVIDAMATIAQTYKYVYDESEDPAGAFEWWLTPCGGSDLVPESIKKAFDILGSVTDAGSWRSPKNIKKGSGKRGDKINPRTRSPLPRGNRPGPSSGGQKPPNRNPNKPGNKKKCLIKLGKDLKRMGQSGVKNTVRSFSCDNDKTVTKDMVITSLKYGPAPTKVVKHCDKAYSQACFHYSSAISVSPQWSTLTCPPEAATTAYRLDASATKSWNAQHAHPAWIATDAPGRTWDKACDRDEYPPAYFLTENDPAFKYAGSKTPGGQLMRYLPNEWNQRAGQMWKGACFGSLVVKMSDQDVVGEVTRASKKRSKNIAVGHTEITALVDVDEHPEFSITWGQAGSHPVDDGLADNPCWPKIIAAGDPGGFALLNADPYVVNQGGPKYDYKKAP
ncbi:hypothetical protein QQS21_000577 [Conoideocrella luteorostrata]|uniref:Uncharacterized protein n=1 Tax=Conoideocrella luteorostrata TaxID=1105319 RepID=A0AAJ0FYE5_9HYPO|nr:hypothetical protein QQS21_000577 [Conoideocrella luteorostrata]